MDINENPVPASCIPSDDPVGIYSAYLDMNCENNANIREVNVLIDSGSLMDQTCEPDTAEPLSDNESTLYLFSKASILEKVSSKEINQTPSDKNKLYKEQPKPIYEEYRNSFTIGQKVLFHKSQQYSRSQWVGPFVVV